MKNRLPYYAPLAAALLICYGCREQNPVQLNDDNLQAQNIVLQNRGVTIEPFDASLPDTQGFFIASQETWYGTFIIAGAEYDGAAGHHDATYVRAEFANRAEPVIFGGDTLAYRFDDAGAVSIDDVPLRAEPVHLNMPNAPVDTIGTRYRLLDIDGSGGRGLGYYGGHRYQLMVGGSGSLPPFTAEIGAPRKLHVTSPPAGALLSRRENVQFRWQGGGDLVALLICSLEGGSPRPIFQLKVRKNNGKLLLPKRILQLLPENRGSFLFTFSSESSSVMRLDRGYSEPIALRAITSHSLVYSLNR
jgi:hypothetical protein